MVIQKSSCFYLRSKEFFTFCLQVSAAGKCVLVTSCDSKIGVALAKQLDELVSLYKNKTDILFC